MKENHKLILGGAGLFVAGVIVGMIVFTQIYLISSNMCCKKNYNTNRVNKYVQPLPYEDNKTYRVIPLESSPIKYEQNGVSFSEQGNIGTGSGSMIQFVGNGK